MRLALAASTSSFSIRSPKMIAPSAMTEWINLGFAVVRQRSAFPSIATQQRTLAQVAFVPDSVAKRFWASASIRLLRILFHRFSCGDFCNSIPSIADIGRTSRKVGEVPILLQKSAMTGGDRRHTPI